MHHLYHTEGMDALSLQWIGKTFFVETVQHTGKLFIKEHGHISIDSSDSNLDSMPGRSNYDFYTASHGRFICVQNENASPREKLLEKENLLAQHNIICNPLELLKRDESTATEPQGIKRVSSFMWSAHSSSV